MSSQSGARRSGPRPRSRASSMVRWLVLMPVIGSSSLVAYTGAWCGGPWVAAEIVPVEVKTKKGVELVTTDEHPRATDLAKISKLAPVFKKEG
jgi:hypothetical protein